jgi:hypothetical protein
MAHLDPLSSLFLSSSPPPFQRKRVMNTADALAHVSDSVLDFSHGFESSTEKLIGALKPAYDASPTRRVAAMHLAEKEEMWFDITSADTILTMP